MCETSPYQVPESEILAAELKTKKLGRWQAPPQGYHTKYPNCPNKLTGIWRYVGWPRIAVLNRAKVGTIDPHMPIHPLFAREQWSILLNRRKTRVTNKLYDRMRPALQIATALMLSKKALALYARVLYAPVEHFTGGPTGYNGFYLGDYTASEADIECAKEHLLEVVPYVRFKAEDCKKKSRCKVDAYGWVCKEDNPAYAVPVDKRVKKVENVMLAGKTVGQRHGRGLIVGIDLDIIGTVLNRITWSNHESDPDPPEDYKQREAVQLAVTICHEMMHVLEILRFEAWDGPLKTGVNPRKGGRRVPVAWSKDFCDPTSTNEFGLELEKELIGYKLESLTDVNCAPVWGLGAIPIVSHGLVDPNRPCDGKSVRKGDPMYLISLHWIAWWFDSSNLQQLMTGTAKIPNIETNAGGWFCQWEKEPGGKRKRFSIRR